MYQQEIKFFWPLTEQIPLDLDYSNCDKTNCTLTTNNDIMHTVGVNASSYITSSNITIDTITTNELVLMQEKQPGVLKKLIYKLMGITWEIK
jgi:hypothetical protein